MQARVWAAEHNEFKPYEEALVRRRRLAHEWLVSGRQEAEAEVAAAERRTAKAMKRNFPEDDLQEQEDLPMLAKKQLAHEDLSWQMGLPLGSAGESYTLTARHRGAVAPTATPLQPAKPVDLLLSREGVFSLLEASALQLLTLVGLACFVNLALAAIACALVAAIRCVRKSQHAQRWHVRAMMRGRKENYDKKVDDVIGPL